MATVTTPSEEETRASNSLRGVIRVCLRKKEHTNAATVPYNAQRTAEKPMIREAINTTTDIKVCQFSFHVLFRSGISSLFMEETSFFTASKCTMKNTET